MRSFYFAGMYSRKHELRAYADEVEKLGYVVTSRWLFTNLQDMQTPGAFLDSERMEFARADFEDVMRAHALVAFTEDPEMEPKPKQARGGRHVELGMALGVQKPVFIVGPRENIFCYLPQANWYPTFQAFKERL